MLGIKYETWEKICKMYFELREGTQKSFLQWFPLTRLTDEDKKAILSKTFYLKYIKTLSFSLFDEAMQQTENFLQKSDGSFRRSSLISPFLYLTMQAIGKEIHDNYRPYRNSKISVYYAGNYELMRAKYKDDYDAFFKEINSLIDVYQYFIKTDISNFFSNIDIDFLIECIDKNCNRDNVIFTQTQLHLYKELLLYCGNGRFPLLENSVASSYLSTIIYLDEADNKLIKFMTSKINEFSDFHLVRYVDDLYILVSSEKQLDALIDTYNEIRNEYSSILKSVGLSLNTKKCCIKKMDEINSELKKSLYDEFFKGKKHDIEELFPESIMNFLNSLSDEYLSNCVDNEKYNDIINLNFSLPDIEFTPSEVFNYFVYENDNIFKSDEIIKEIKFLVDRSISFITLDPKRLTAMIMKTKDTDLIKAFLNQLFIRHKAGLWNSYDTNIGITYLIQSGFKHMDLLNIIESREPDLYNFYNCNCKNSFLTCLNNKETDMLLRVVNNDPKGIYLYFMYLCELKRKNMMGAFAYFKNFFDRITADIDCYVAGNCKKGKPNYKAFYRENTFIQYYSGVTGSDILIHKAHAFRNSNPLSHSSSELIDNNNSSTEIKNCIDELLDLIFIYLSIK